MPNSPRQSKLKKTQTDEPNFVMIPIGLISALSDAEFKTYAASKSFDWTGKGAFPKQETIAARAGKSERAVRRDSEGLLAKGAMVRRRRRHSYHYDFPPIPNDWKPADLAGSAGSEPDESGRFKPADLSGLNRTISSDEVDKGNTPPAKGRGGGVSTRKKREPRGWRAVGPAALARAQSHGGDSQMPLTPWTQTAAGTWLLGSALGPTARASQSPGSGPEGTHPDGPSASVNGTDPGESSTGTDPGGSVNGTTGANGTTPWGTPEEMMAKILAQRDPNPGSGATAAQPPGGTRTWDQVYRDAEKTPPPPKLPEPEPATVEQIAELEERSRLRMEAFYRLSAEERERLAAELRAKARQQAADDYRTRMGDTVTHPQPEQIQADTQPEPAPAPEEPTGQRSADWVRFKTELLAKYHPDGANLVDVPPPDACGAPPGVRPEDETQHPAD